MEKQTTIKRQGSLKGVGLHTGAPCAIRLAPAPANTGIVFIKEGVRIPALVEFVCESERCTTLILNGTVIKTVEHFLSALKGMSIDNCIIEVTGEEMPAMDGSAKDFVSALKDVGIVSLDTPRPMWEFKESKPFVFTLKNSSYKILPSKSLALSVSISYPNTPIGVQEIELTNLINYPEDFAPARTYCLENEVKSLFNSGLAKGGSLKNTIVVGKNGIKTEEPLRYRDEFVRHKLLDLLGDLSLLGLGEFCFNLSSFAPSHQTNVALVKMLREKLT